MNVGKESPAREWRNTSICTSSPRWTGDTNFLSVVGETCRLPESMEETYKRLKAKV